MEDKNKLINGLTALQGQYRTCLSIDNEVNSLALSTQNRPTQPVETVPAHFVPKLEVCADNISRREWVSDHIWIRWVFWTSFVIFCGNFLYGVIAPVVSGFSFEIGLLVNGQGLYALILLPICVLFFIVPLIVVKKENKRQENIAAQKNISIQNENEIAKKRHESLVAEVKKQYQQKLQAFQQAVLAHNVLVQNANAKIAQLKAQREAIRANMKSSVILPSPYNDVDYEFVGEHPINAMLEYLLRTRADNLKEAINLYEQEEREARRDYDDTRHKSAVQAEATAHRLAAENAARIAQESAAEQRRIASASAILQARMLESIVEEQQRQSDIVQREAEEQQQLREKAKEALRKLDN